MNAPNNLWVATRKGLFRMRREGASWAVAAHHFPGENVVATAALADGSIIASLRLGHFGPKLHRSSDGGATWSEMPCPKLPEKPSSGPFASDPTPWSVEMVWELAQSPPSADGKPARLWAACMPAAVFTSDDSGASWQLCESFWADERRLQWMGGGNDFPAAHTLLAHPTHPLRASVAVSCGGFWATRDGGASWALEGRGFFADFMPPEAAGDPNAQDIHRAQSCAAQPDVVWTQMHGGIYRSTDGGANFSRLEAIPGIGDFGFALAVCPRNPQRAWVVPAVSDTYRYAPGGAMCVARTDDAGKSWNVLRSGLPQQDAYDLVLRHGLALADDGQTLAMGSSTGSLWISGDAGESWQTISTHLPPIAAVRWG
jgi:photosystem II stability/assembly factor-like uncharacterized protein